MINKKENTVHSVVSPGVRSRTQAERFFLLATTSSEHADGERRRWRAASRPAHRGLLGVRRRRPPTEKKSMRARVSKAARSAMVDPSTARMCSAGHIPAWRYSYGLCSYGLYRYGP